MDKRKRQILVLQVVNVAAYLVMIILNALANILPINNQTTGGVSDKYANLFAPAGITFAIWGLIYLMLGLFILYQTGLFTKETDAHEPVVLKVGWLFALSSVANALWILFWHHDLILVSLLFMLIILVSLLFITQRLSGEKPDWRQKWLCNHAFSVYLGWISVATIANATTLFVSLGWNGFGIPEWVWTLLLMVIASVLACVRLFRQADRPFSLVVAWALTGIVIKHVTIFEVEYPQIVLAGVFLIGWVLATAASSLLVAHGIQFRQLPLTNAQGADKIKDAIVDRITDLFDGDGNVRMPADTESPEVHATVSVDTDVKTPVEPSVDASVPEDMNEKG